MMWIPVVAPTATSGTVLNFTGPYPQTIELQGNYTLNVSAHPYDNLNVAAIVQGYQSNSVKEVFNAFFAPIANVTGIDDNESEMTNSTALLGAYPNPSTGSFSVSSMIPDGTTGIVEIFDIAGRSIEHFSAGAVQTMNIEETGVYFIRLTTSSGEVVRKQVAVVR